MQDSNNLIEKAGSDYLITSGMGAHKLHIRKLPWNKARRICIQEGGEFLIMILLYLMTAQSKCSATFLPHFLRAITLQRKSYLVNSLLY